MEIINNKHEVQSAALDLAKDLIKELNGKTVDDFNMNELADACNAGIQNTPVMRDNFNVAVYELIEGICLKNEHNETIFSGERGLGEELGRLIYWAADNGRPPRPVWKNVTDRGAPLATKHNFEIFLDTFNIKPVMNNLTGEGELYDLNKNKYKTLADIKSSAAVVRLNQSVVDDYWGVISRDAVTYHPISEKIDLVDWDGVDRVSAIIDCLPVEDDLIEYRDSVMRRWMRSSVAYLYTTFSSRLVPIIQGKENDGKSLFFHRLFDWSDGFNGDAHINLSDKDSIRRSVCNWVTEISEPQSFFKSNSGSDIKRFITGKVDRLRPPYWKEDMVKERQTAFCCTVNKNDFLDSSEENTRFQVIPLIDKVDLDRLNEILGLKRVSDTNEVVVVDDHRLQVFAQLKHEVDAGESYSITQSIIDFGHEHNRDFAEVSPTEEVLMKYWDFSDIYLNDKRKRVGSGIYMTTTEVEKWLQDEPSCTVKVSASGRHGLGSSLGKHLDRIKEKGTYKYKMPKLTGRSIAGAASKMKPSFDGLITT